MVVRHANFSRTREFLKDMRISQAEEIVSKKEGNSILEKPVDDIEQKIEIWSAGLKNNKGSFIFLNTNNLVGIQ